MTSANEDLAAAVAASEAMADVTDRNLVNPAEKVNAGPRAFHVTIFPNKSAQVLTAKVMPIWDLRDLILNASADAKEDLQWLKLARFGNRPTPPPQSCLRNNANVDALSGIVAEHDKGTMPFDEAVRRLRKEKLTALVYTSPSHTEARQRWRVVVPCSRDLEGCGLDATHTKLVARINGVLAGVISNESFTLSQAYYFGKVGNNSAHRAEYTSGGYIDERVDLDSGAVSKPKANGQGGVRGFEGNLARLGDGDGLDGFHNPLRSAVASYVTTHGGGFDRAALKVLLREAVAHAPMSEHRDRSSDRYLDALIESAARKYGSAAVPEGAADAPAFSEEDLALQFATRHAGDTRYVAAWSRWLRFDGTRWKHDETRETFSLARKLCREVAGRVNKLKEAKTIANAKTRAAVVSLAGEDRRLAATIEQWDSDPWLLNTPGGVADLRTGECCGHCGEDYMTKITAVAPDSEMLTPMWDKFLDRVTNQDRELKSFLQRMLGYALTGITDEHALFFLYGTGGNGKGVFMNAAANILADYHRVAPIETFTATNTEQHPTDLAMLRGARMVSATETEEGRRWAESRIKQLTGGDRISARFMRQDFFEYTPQFKLIISGNHKPGLRSVDEAIRRRFNLIPFTVTIPERERDKELGTNLRDEYPGILAWMIEGCDQWQRKGLAPPKAVTEATKGYLEEEDMVALWVEECCTVGKQYESSSIGLFKSWKEWAEGHGEYVGSSKRFHQKLETLGFAPVRTKTGRGFRGLKLGA
jgi:putative DNA primase/helicase